MKYWNMTDLSFKILKSDMLKHNNLKKQTNSFSPLVDLFIKKFLV